MMAQKLPIRNSSHRREDDPRSRTRGVALVAVLWIVSLLALLAAGAASSSRTDVRLAYNRVEHAKAQALADAGVDQALYLLMTNPEDLDWQNGSVTLRRELEGGGLSVRISDEDAKLDVNAASVELLTGLFKAIGLGDDQARHIAERLQDFRDEDSEPLPFGAEDDAYLAEGRVDGAADRPFRDIFELNDVLGMTGEIYRRIRPFVTVYGDVDGFEPNRAAITTLLALPGVTPNHAETIASLPPGADLFLSLPTEIAAEIEPFLVPSRGLIFSISSLGKSDDGGLFLREAIVALNGGRRSLPFTIHAWDQGHPSSTSDEAAAPN